MQKEGWLRWNILSSNTWEVSYTIGQAKMGLRGSDTLRGGIRTPCRARHMARAACPFSILFLHRGALSVDSVHRFHVKMVEKRSLRHPRQNMIIMFKYDCRNSCSSASRATPWSWPRNCQIQLSTARVSISMALRTPVILRLSMRCHRSRRAKLWN